MILPRPEVSDLLGINYRRVPVFVIGRNAYCDTSLISSAVEKHYAEKDGHGTLFPKRKGGGSSDTGMIKAFALSYADSMLFPLGAASLPYEKMPEKFIKDRSLVINWFSVLVEVLLIHNHVAAWLFNQCPSYS